MSDEKKTLKRSELRFVNMYKECLKEYYKTTEFKLFLGFILLKTYFFYTDSVLYSAFVFIYEMCIIYIACALFYVVYFKMHSKDILKDYEIIEDEKE
jgi:hypothetical protein